MTSIKALPRLIQALVCLFIFSSVSVAQEPDLLSIEFRSYSLGKPIPDLYYYDGSDYQLASVPNNQRSPAYSYKGLPELKFFNRTMDSEGQPIYTVTGSTTLSRGNSKVFVTFLPYRDDSGELKFHIYNVEDTFSTSRSDNWMILNLTPKKLVSKIESDITPFSLVPGKSQFVKPTPRDNNSYIFSVAEEVDGEWKLVYNATWPHAENKRAIVFIMPRGENPNGVKVKRMYERIVPPPVVEE